MKKIFITCFAALFGMVAVAQPRSIGGSIGWSETITYQHCASSENFIELNLGYHCGLLTSIDYSSVANGYVDNYYDVAQRSAGTLRLTATYNMIVLSPKWTSKGDWNIYAGPGLSIGSGFNIYKAFCFGVTGQAGLEYNFWFPLTLSADLKPTIGLMVSNRRIKYDVEGLMGFIPTISAKYRF